MKAFECFSDDEIDILKARARRIAHVANEGQDTDVVVALEIQISGEKYALPIERLKAIYEDIPVIPVPCVPPYIGGIANIRGHIVPVLDLNVLLNVRDNEAENRKLVLATNDVLTAAFQVEIVGEFFDIPRNQITPFPAGSDQATYLQGVLENGAGLLNIDGILGDPSLVVDKEFA